MVNTPTVQVQVCYALPDSIYLHDLTLPAGCTVGQAILASDVLQRHTDINLSTAKIGVYGKLKTMAQADKIFAHPHDVCVDDDGSIYVAQWASGKVYPYKLTRV